MAREITARIKVPSGCLPGKIAPRGSTDDDTTQQSKHNHSNRSMTVTVMAAYLDRWLYLD